MTTDDFVEAARAEAERRADLAADPEDFEHGLITNDFLAGAGWARDYLAAQDPSAAEVDAGITAAAQYMPAAWWGGTEWRLYAAEILSAARAARRDEEKPYDGSPTTDCGRGPCCLGDGHDGDCRL